LIFIYHTYYTAVNKGKVQTRFASVKAAAAKWMAAAISLLRDFLTEKKQELLFPFNAIYGHGDCLRTKHGGWKRNGRSMVVFYIKPCYKLLF